MHHLMNPWQRAIGEALIVNCLDCTHASESPELAARQSVADEPRCTAAGGHAEIINVPGYPLMVRAVDYNALRAQLAEAQRDAERLDWIIEHRAYVVSDPDCCDGYWLNYARPDGTMWTQATEHETPRAAIDAAKGETS